ncbi:MAG TPA: class I SAM-dependent methyltransferase [Bryobacteraceae bacterium]|nr:class I SAM-dependent methyltransferase [Bryobacteraceae bacterium]
MNPDWFRTFFDGLALEMWRGAMSPQQTAVEAEFLARHLNLKTGGAVLDVPCGNGRHAIELAARGIRMTGVDLSAGFLAEARAKAPGCEWILGDMRELSWDSRFDAAYCCGNSFGYFDAANCERFLNAVARALKPGARFLLECGAVAETLLPVLQPERRMKIGDLDFYSINVYNAEESRMDITYTFTLGERSETKTIHHWIFTAGEIRRMFRRAGLEPVTTFGDFEGTPLALRSQRFIGLAVRT